MIREKINFFNNVDSINFIFCKSIDFNILYLLINELQTSTMLDFIREYLEFVMHTKKYWVIPIIILLFLFSALIVVTEGTSVFPFVYTIF